jgi:hypothetical protein
MSRLPTFPYRCVVFKKPMSGSHQMPPPENHNYQNLAGAIAYRAIALRRPSTKRVEIIMVLDESTPASAAEELACIKSQST